MAGVAGLPSTNKINECDADSGRNSPAETTGNPLECRTSGLAVLAADLRRRRPNMPAEARNHASNLIEQLDGIKTHADLERMRPFMARSMRLLEASR